MATGLLVLRVALATVLGVAAIAKLRDRSGSAAAATNLGVPERHSRLVGRLLPIAELSTAAFILLPATARIGSLAGFALVSAFTIAITLTLRSGRRPNCRCFGQLSDSPIGTATLVRNVLLLIVATTITLGGSSSETSLADVVAAHSPATVLNSLGGILAVLTVGAIVLVSDHRGLRARIDALEAGTSPTIGIAVGRPAPTFSLPDLDGRHWSLAEVIADRPALLVFTDAGCVPCATLLPELADWSYAYAETFRLVLVAGGGRDANVAKRDEHGLAPVLLQRGDEVARAFRYRGTPAATVVGTDGTIIEAMASGTDEVRALVSRVITLAGGVRLPVGISAPPFHVHGGDGGHIDNTAMRGTMTVVLFWDEACSFCAELDAEIRVRLDGLEPAGVAMLVVSASGGTGWPATVGVTVANDAGRFVATAFGSPGTPSAVLVDADGKIASAMAVGREEVLALVDRAVSMGKLAGSIAVRRA